MMTENTLCFDQIDSPIGDIGLSFDAAGLHAVEMLNGRAGSHAPGRRAPYPHAGAFERFFDGELDALARLPVVMHGSDFQRRVWSALQDIPPGRTLSYAQLAERIGNRRASRAVGSANGRNALCIVVPCHRVIAADGTLGGYSAGLDVKRWLLRHEGAAFRA